MDIRNTQIYQNHLNEDRIRFVRDRFPSGLKALMFKNITTVRLKFLSQLLSKKFKKKTNQAIFDLFLLASKIFATF